MSDSNNPLFDLLEQNTAKTELDNRIDQIMTQKSPNQAQEDSQDNKSVDEDGPITLKIRQPSFSSLHGELITKAGQTVTDLPEVKEEDPVIVIENQETNEIPASISYHPSSYSSIGNHHIEMGKDLYNIEPPKTIPIEEVPDDEENQQDSRNDDEEEEECPEVQIVKELKSKNESRWKEMGFVPPNNLIELTREASRSKFHPNTSLPTNQTPAFDGIAEEEPESPLSPQQPQLSPQHSNSTNLDSAPKPVIRPKHQRCGSNGMKLGEASSSLVRMSQALMIPEKTESKEMPDAIDEVDEIREFIEEEEEEEEDEFELENEEPHSFNQDDVENYSDKQSYTEKESYVDDKNELFGRLNLIVKQPKSSNVYQIILKNSSYGIRRSEQSDVRHMLKEILDQCVENLWIDESEYINNLINTLGASSSPKKSPKKQGKELSQLQTLRDRYKKAQHKYSNLINSENIKHKNRIDQLMREYHKKASELDEKYQSEEMISKFSRPSPQLVAMREHIKNLLRSNQIDLARTENISVMEQEEKETKENSRVLREKYYIADRKLKELYAGKREILNMKHKLAIQGFESSKNSSKKKYEKLIARAKEEKSKRRDIDISNIDVENAAPLPMKRPKSLNRNRDDKLIEAMALEIEKGKDIGKVDIDALFRSSSKSHSKSTSNSNAPRSKNKK